jgi:hypothetical protein
VKDRININFVGGVVALIVMGVYAFTVIYPYFLPPGMDDDIVEIIRSNKETVNLVTMAVVMFFFGASVGRQLSDDSISTLAKTNAAAQAALAPLASNTPPGALVIPEGGSATASATPDGTVITTDLPKP